MSKSRNIGDEIPGRVPSYLRPLGPPPVEVLSQVALTDLSLVENDEARHRRKWRDDLSIPPSLRKSSEVFSALQSSSSSVSQEQQPVVKSLVECDSVELMASLESLSQINRQSMLVSKSRVGGASTVDTGGSVITMGSQWNAGWAIPAAGRRMVEQKRQFLERLPGYPRSRNLVEAACLEDCGRIDLRGRSLGDDKVAMVALALLDLASNSSLRGLLLSDNRLTDEGCALILDALVEVTWESLYELNLSDNTMGKKSVELLRALVDTCESLQSLLIARTNLGGAILKILTPAFLDCGLRRLDLAGNGIDDEGIMAFAEVFEQGNMRLSWLDLSNNNIRARGAIALWKALSVSKTLEELDVSWNGFGSSDTKEAGKVATAIGETLRDNKSILHLNLSYCQLNATQVSTIGKLLADNRTLLGCHLNGNEGHMNAFGDMIPSKHPWPLAEQHDNSLTELRVFDMSGTVQCSPRNCCWVCSRWTESYFHKRVPASEVASVASSVAAARNAKVAALKKKAKKAKSKGKGAVDAPPSPVAASSAAANVRYCDLELFMLASLDDWEPTRMWLKNDQDERHSNEPDPTSPKKNKGAAQALIPSQVVPKGKSVIFDCHRMMPPGTHYIFFRLNTDMPITFDPNQTTEEVSVLRARGVVFPEETSGLILPTHCNVIHIEDPRVNAHLPSVQSMRKNGKSIRTRPRNRNEKGLGGGEAWLLEDSVFYPEISTHSTSHHNRVHNADWASSKAKKLYESNEKLSVEIEQVFRKHAACLQQVFMHYCCIYSSELFFMTVTAYNELLMTCNILEVSTLTTTASEVASSSAPFAVSKATFSVSEDSETEQVQPSSQVRPTKPANPRASFRRTQRAASVMLGGQKQKQPTVPSGGPPSKVRRLSHSPRPSVLAKPPAAASVGRRSSLATQGKSPRKSTVMADKPPATGASNVRSTAPQDPNAPRVTTMSKGFNRTEAEMVFIAGCISGPRHALNSKRSLSRGQFIDCLVSIATSKFFNTKLVPTIPDALEKLIGGCIMNHAEWHDAVAFRKQFCLIESMDHSIKSRQGQLDRLFLHNSGELCLPNEPKAMSSPEWMVFSETCLDGTGLQERQLKLAFSRSQAIPDNFWDDAFMFKKLTKLEFYEAMVRVAHASIVAGREGGEVAILVKEENAEGKEGDTEKSQRDTESDGDGPQSALGLLDVESILDLDNNNATEITPLMVQERFELIVAFASTFFPKKKSGQKAP